MERVGGAIRFSDPLHPPHAPECRGHSHPSKQTREKKEVGETCSSPRSTARLVYLFLLEVHAVQRNQQLLLQLRRAGFGGPLQQPMRIEGVANCKHNQSKQRLHLNIEHKAEQVLLLPPYEKLMPSALPISFM